MYSEGIRGQSPLWLGFTVQYAFVVTRLRGFLQQWQGEINEAAATHLQLEPAYLALNSRDGRVVLPPAGVSREVPDVVLESLNHRLHEERHEAEFYAMFIDESLFISLTDRHNPRHINFIKSTKDRCILLSLK